MNKIIIVKSDDAAEPTDEVLEQMAFELMGAKKPSLTRKVIRKTPLLANLETFVIAYKVIAQKGMEEEKGLRIDREMGLVVDLMRKIYQNDTASFLPNATIVQVGDSALESMRFLDGGNQYLEDTVYVMHPVDTDAYISIANYHDYLVHDKSADFVKLVTALGAKSLTLVKTNNKGQKSEMSASTEDKLTQSESSLNASLGKRVVSKFDLSLTCEQPIKLPRLPPDIKWLCREPLWAAMADSRLENWITSFRVSLSYSQDFDVNIDLATRVAGMGFNIGGSFAEISDFEQIYDVEFFPFSSYEDL